MITESTPALTQHSHILPMKLTFITATMATDLSAAFDTINNVELIDKLAIQYNIAGQNNIALNHSIQQYINILNHNTELSTSI